MVAATREEIELYLKNVGKRGLNTLSTLGKLQPFVQLMETDLGFALVGDLVNRYDELLNRISDLTATEEEKIEFKVTKTFLLNIATRLDQYTKTVQKIKTLR
jgi:hypothetical protein